MEKKIFSDILFIQIKINNIFLILFLFNLISKKMFNRIEEKFSGKDKKKTVGFLKEKDKQELRKKNNNISRILANYYDPKIHSRAWYPNGIFHRKKYYYYADSGLGYFYEKNNVEQLKIVSDSKKKNILQNFVEYKFLQENQFVVTIEYCANCEEHKMHTFHNSELYKNYAMSIQKCISLRFPFVNILLKPIDTDILKENEFKLPKVKNGQSYNNFPFTNDKFKQVRIGAMEIQICAKKNGKEIKTGLVHSKLQTGKWPKINVVLDKIVSFLPLFHSEIVLYNKEENSKDENNNISETNENDLIKNSLLENIQINIYLLKNTKIQSIAENAWNEIQNDLDPHKRKEILKENKLLAKESLVRPGTSSVFNLKKNRPFTSLARKSASSTNIFSRPFSEKIATNSLLFENKSLIEIKNSSQFSRPGQEIISNKNLANDLKGKLILTKFTNKEGTINFGPLPYDSYLIEVCESKQFMGTFMTLIFDQIVPNETVKKFLGLFVQTNAFLQINTYETVKDSDGKDDQIHVKNCKVSIESFNNDDYSNSNQNLNEIKIEIDEKKDSQGIYETMVPPGTYLISVQKENYEIVRKFYDLEKGFNSINIEMTTEKNVELKLSVYSYEKFQEETYEPIQNAEISIYKNSHEVIFEGISDKNGDLTFTVTKGEDFLTVIVNKLGYFPVQRIFVRNNNFQVNENNEYKENYVFFLVSEKFLHEQHCMICVTYSGFYDTNFEPSAIQLSDNIKDNIELSCFDGQKENGVLGTFIKYKAGKSDEKTEKKNVISEENYVNDEDDNFDEVVLMSFNIKTENLKVHNFQDKGFSMNGLERFGCLSIIYTENNVFYLPAPSYCKEGYCIWNLGWLDVKNQLFYEINTLSVEIFERILYFSSFLDFIQKIIDNKIYLNLFEIFGFDKGILINNDRFIYENTMMKVLKNIKFMDIDNKDNRMFICNMMKSGNKLISFNLIKKKIASNLKNFKEENEIIDNSTNFSKSINDIKNSQSLSNQMFNFNK